MTMVCIIMRAKLHTIPPFLVQMQTLSGRLPMWTDLPAHGMSRPAPSAALALPAVSARLRRRTRFCPRRPNFPRRRCLRCPQFGSVSSPTVLYDLPDLSSPERHSRLIAGRPAAVKLFSCRHAAAGVESSFREEFVMFKPLVLALPRAAVLFFLFSLNTWAQGSSAASGSRADPADAGSPAPRAVHRSSFSTYRRFADQEVADWRESNDNVGRIGGWRAYAQESRPSKPAAKSPAPPAAPGSAPKPAPAAKSPLAPPVKNPSGSNSAPSTSGDASDAHQHH